ncbi:WD domain G-beta repeat family protein [Cryptosporidium meleagridis]|uniref:WD domain G-beta repeat family protein n=1 Tax=Cryptosporidium meleagridis TaxID=93969 RepID=A0A2P4Z2S5_9CRYT|nr:WD domain G-beta repeat family protein [Cryptosporidium meleagridis]
MGDYIPIEIESKRKALYSEILSNNRYLYSNSGNENETIKNLEFRILNGEISLLITTGSKLKTVSPIKINDENSSKLTSFNSKSLITATTLRKDGRLCGVSMENNECVALDTETMTVVRRFEKSSEQLSSIVFSCDKSKIISGSLTGKISISEVSSGEIVFTAPAHNDVIKSILPLENKLFSYPNPDSSVINTINIYFATCSYDFNIKIWCFSELKQAENYVASNASPNKYQLKVMKTLKHNFPVECIDIINENKLISCGGTCIKIWDLEKNEIECIHSITNFARTITTISSNEKIFVVGCLDHNVCIYDSKTFEFIRSFNYNKGIVKVATSNCSSYIAIALEDGSWSIRKKISSEIREATGEVTNEDINSLRKGYRTGTIRYYKRGRGASANAMDIEIKNCKKRQTKLDRLLRSYSYKKALEIALKMSWPHFISLLKLLSSRGALHLIARENEYEKTIKLLKYISKNMSKCSPHQFILISELIEHILHESNIVRLLNQNKSAENKNEIFECIKKISQKVSLETKQHVLLKEIKIAVEIIIQNCKRYLVN